MVAASTAAALAAVLGRQSHPCQPFERRQHNEASDQKPSAATVSTSFPPEIAVKVHGIGGTDELRPPVPCASIAGGRLAHHSLRLGIDGSERLPELVAHAMHVVTEPSVKVGSKRGGPSSFSLHSTLDKNTKPIRIGSGDIHRSHAHGNRLNRRRRAVSCPPTSQGRAMCSGRIGTRRSGSPVASRTAATMAGVDESVGGSPAPRRP